MLLEWEIWLNVHISPIIAKWLKEETEWGIHSAYSLQLLTASDKDFFQRAKQQANVILISKDTDFAELINKFGSPPKLIQIKIRNCDNKILFQFLKSNIHQAINYLIKFNKDIVELE